MPDHMIAYCDGGVRGTPGPHACAAVLWFDGKVVDEEAKYLGIGTGNQAEWQGLLLAMEMASRAGVKNLKVRMDSKLVVEQVLGNWRIKTPSLAPYFKRAQELAGDFDSVEIKHVRREKNRVADALCTQLLDEITGRRRQP